MPHGYILSINDNKRSLILLRANLSYLIYLSKIVLRLFDFFFCLRNIGD